MSKDAMADLRSLTAKLLHASDNKPERAVGSLVQALQNKSYLRALALDFLQKTAANGFGVPPPSGPEIGSIKVGSFKVNAFKVSAHRRRTAEEKNAAIEARTSTMMALALDKEFNGKKLRDFAKHELPALQRELINGTASYIRFGTDEARFALLVKKIDGYAQTDPNTFVGDFISPSVCRMLDKQAIAEAPAAIEGVMHETARAFGKQLDDAVAKQLRK
jgi:hypothetical protein